MGASSKHGGACEVVREASAAQPGERDPRAVAARALLEKGWKRLLVAGNLGVSVSGLAGILERDARRVAEAERARAAGRMVGDEDACHLVCFDMPPPALVPDREPGTEAAWADRHAFADRLERIAAPQHRDVRAGILHLADLHRFHPTFYPQRRVEPSDCAPPVRLGALRDGDMLASSGPGYVIPAH